MFDLYLPSVFPSDLVECRPERKEGADGEKGKDHQNDGEFRPLRQRLQLSCLSVQSRTRFIHFPIRLSLQCLQVAVFQNREALDGKPVRVVVRARGVQQTAARYEAALRHVALADNHLPRVGIDLVGIAVEIADHRIDLQRLIDIAREPGRSAPLREPSPLRTVHESFPSYGSSNSKFLL